MNYTQLDTPIGRLTIVAEDAGLLRIQWDGEEPMKGSVEGRTEVLDRAARQLDEYFAGARRSFDLPLALVGTPFQRKVWLELAAIPYGTTISYGEQARRLGRPRAARAVGAANGANPVPIVLPCHRVIGAGGALTGFGGGLDIKRDLLALEARSLCAG